MVNSEADSYQVGGVHYKTSYEHWTWCLDIGLGYLEGNATKYLSRAGKKGSVKQDLEKALHYIRKLEENVVLCIRTRHMLPIRWVALRTERFIALNYLSGEVAGAILSLATWETPPDLQVAERLVRSLIEQLTVVAKEVPLEDSNKHAPRSDTE
jgi:hypothetical protein